MKELIARLAELGGGAAAVTAVFAVLTVVVLPRAERFRSKMPIALLAIFGLSAAVHHMTPVEHVAHDAFGVIGLLFLLVSLARSTLIRLSSLKALKPP